MVFAPGGALLRRERVGAARRSTPPDSTLDRLAGLRGPSAFDSSGRFHDLPRYRASSAFDGDPSTAWLGIWARPVGAVPVDLVDDRPAYRRLGGCASSRAAEPARRPTVVRLSWPGGTARPAARWAPTATVALPRPRARARASG